MLYSSFSSSLLNTSINPGNYAKGNLRKTLKILKRGRWISDLRTRITT